MSNGEVIVKKESLTLERIALTAMVALLSWNVWTTSELVTDLAVMSAKVELLAEQLDSASSDRYTGAQARADQALLEQRIQRLEQWNGRLSDRLNEAESKIDSVIDQ